MKSIASVLFATLALSSLHIAHGVKCLPQTCPGTNCYVEYVSDPSCKPNEPCPLIAIKANICEWTCGKEAPAGCTDRCKPCPAGEICTKNCVCQLVCTEGICAPPETK